MRTIKQGTPPNKQIWLGECQECDSVIAAERGELDNIKSDTREGSQFCWSACPECGAGGDSNNPSAECWGGVCFHPLDECSTELRDLYHRDVSETEMRP